MEKLEQGQILLGTTGLEDKLQENVHECIEEFRRANIKIWMITGDKLETAESVGVSCRLLQDEERRLFITSGTCENETVQGAQEVLNIMQSRDTLKLENSRGLSQNYVENYNIEEEKKVNKNELNKSDLSSQNLGNGIGTSYKDFKTKNKDSKSIDLEKEGGQDNFNLNLEEKNKYVNNIVRNAGLNSLLSKDITFEKESDETYELVIEGETLVPLLKEENKHILKEIIKNSWAILV